MVNGGNIITAINSTARSVIRYGSGIVAQWQKLLTMYGVHHPKANVDRLYLKLKQEEIRLEWKICENRSKQF